MIYFFPKKYGKNYTGKHVSLHRGGGTKYLFYTVDFWFSEYGKKSTIGVLITNFYDPNRTSFIGLIIYCNGIYKGQKRFILLTDTLKQGDLLYYKTSNFLSIGMSVKLKQVPINTKIHSIESKCKGGACYARSAGCYSILSSTFLNKSIIKLPSGNLKLLSEEIFCIIGRISNKEYGLKKLTKAGNKRWKSKRPTVRGVAMNSCDHPHGGGEGKGYIGKTIPFSCWGKPSLGIKTRKSKKPVIIFS